MRKTYKDFDEFWPFYVREHSKRGTRMLHFAGTTTLLVLLAAAIWNGSVSSLIAGVVTAYACAWTGHFLIEKNRPATFQYPLLSLMGDFKMYALMLTGRMEKELQRINPRLILKMPRWLDAHTHLDSDELFPQREEVLNRAQQSDVSRILLVNSEATEASFERTLACLQISHPVERFACFGIHPHEAKLYDEAMGLRLKDLLKNSKVIALGECGLDFFYNHSPQDVQIAAFRKQLALAEVEHLPVVIHCRDAYAQLAEILAEHNHLRGGMIHCFTGTREEMKQLLDLGFFISFSGIVTFRKSTELQECAKTAPLDRILIETDAPFLAPVPHRGKRNEPAFVRETARFIAALRDLPEEHLSSAIYSNFEKLFT